MRAPRRLATLTLATTFLLTACGGGENNRQAEPTEGTRLDVVDAAEPTPAPEPTYDTTWDIAEVEWTIEESGSFNRTRIRTAYAVVAESIEEFGFAPRLADRGKDRTVSDFLGPARYMTQNCASDFLSAVEQTSGDSYVEDGSVQVLATHDVGGAPGSDEYVITDKGPKVVNQQILSATAAPDAGTDRIHLTVSSQAEYRVVKKGEPPFLVPIERTTNYYMLEVDGVWKIDGWDGNYQVGKERLDRKAQ